MVLALVALAVIVAFGLRRLLSGYPAPAERVGSLSAREYATVVAAAQATFPHGGDIEPSGVEAGVPGYVDRFIGAQVPQVRRLMRLLLLLVEQATLLFPPSGSGGWRRFSSLSPEQKVEYLDGWRSSRLLPRRLVFTSLRALLTMGYFADPAVLRRLGLAPREILTPQCETDLLWPRVGALPGAAVEGDLLRSRDPATRDAGPLGPSGRLHRDYEAEPR